MDTKKLVNQQNRRNAPDKSVYPLENSLPTCGDSIFILLCFNSNGKCGLNSGKCGLVSSGGKVVE